RRAISRIEARGKGILLLHDIHPRTVLALPEILNELKSRGYKIVHVVPAAADRPKTATSAQQWVARPTPDQHTSPSQMRPLRQGISRRHGQEPEANESSIPRVTSRRGQTGQSHPQSRLLVEIRPAA